MAIGSPQWMYKSGEAYTVDQSLKFNDDDSAYLSKTFASAGNRRTWTWSAWVKRSNSNATHMLFFTAIAGDLTEDDHFGIRLDSGTSSNIVLTWGDGNTAVTNAIFRDPSAWMHIVVAIDTTQSTSTNRVKVYVNGTQQTFSSTDLPSQNHEYGINKAQEHNLGSRVIYGSSANYYDGYLAEVNFIDGQALTPADFGETGDYGEWKPIEYSGTYGTNGFYLPFKQDYSVEGFSTVTYKGTGSTNYIGGTGFSPSMTWTKSTAGGRDHLIFDKVRGQSKPIVPNATGAEETHSTTFESFNTDGFTVGTPAGSGGANSSGERIVAWNWDMGADTPTGFGCVTYKGNGGTQSISGYGFSPDLVWIKGRDIGSDPHQLYDTVRGANESLKSDATDAEITRSNGLTVFEPNGFSVGSHAYNNRNTSEYVAWGWDMGDTTVTNTSGSENSTVRANPTYGQSIVSYEGNEVAGTTFGHGLSSAPELIIVKNLSRSSNWKVYYGDNTKALALNTDGATDDQTYYWNDTSPTSSVFTVGGGTDTNGNDENLVAYCFHSVSGYSKIGSYTGNGSSNGTTVTLGFRPAMIILKPSSAADHWNMYDSTRDPLNPTDSLLFPNRTNAEATGQEIEITDTGFQLKTDNAGSNGNGETYIYMAFAGGMDSISDYNTDGSIDSRVKANPTYGQSIVKYPTDSAEQTVGHGLSSAPEVVITKALGATSSWDTWFTGFSDYQAITLNSNAARYQNSGARTVTSTSSTTVGFGLQMIGSNYYGVGNEMIAYCFHSVTGYSSIGSYSGNGSNTGTVVTTGFAPAFVVIKRTDASANWYMYDNTREPEAEKGKALYTNLSNSESGDYERLKFTSTGFQLTHTDTDLNGSGGTYIYMAFADKREYAYWLDQSGNNNDWTSNNLTESDISVDSPSNNFSTFNPLDPQGTTSITFSEGNLKVVQAASWTGTVNNVLMTSGKWYWEVCGVDMSNSGMGVIKPFSAMYNGMDSANSGYFGAAAGGYGINLQHGNDFDFFTNTTKTTDQMISGYNDGDIISVAYDADTGKIWLAHNNNWTDAGSGTGNPTTGANPAATVSNPEEGVYAGFVLENATIVANFGQDSSFAGNKTAQGNQDSNEIGDFYYTPPTGFLALCTKNLPDVAVVPSEHFNTVLYSGTGSAQSITGVGFQPDFVWIKMRSHADNHVLNDSVRGQSALYSNATNAENTGSTFVTSRDSDGFSVGTDPSVNYSAGNHVAWNWKANGSGSSNTDGTITSTVSANVDAGFSIVSYTGTGSNATIGHGLSKAPEMLIIKNRDQTDDWIVYHEGIGNTSMLRLNTTSAKNTYVTWWNNTSPTSTVFTVSTEHRNNASSENYIAYCFHSVDGYSKVGTYTGNSNADGTFVYTGFRPAFVMLKKIDNAANGSSWVINDSKRAGYNNDNKRLRPNTTGQEDDTGRLDLFSNGFKLTSQYAESNESGVNFIYIAFAETPFKYSNGR